jgi:serpin B
LNRTLAAMGMRSAFDVNADFSGMTGKRDIMISNVIHKAFIDVNEEGTVAAAATAVVMTYAMARPIPLPVFRADHPFVFLIRDEKSGALLFMGRLIDPN